MDPMNQARKILPKKPSLNYWIYGSNEPGKKNSPKKTFFELLDIIPKMIILG